MTHKGFSVIALFQEYPHLELRLIGKHQVINAAAAIGVMEALRFHDIFIDLDSVRLGLYNAIWPGRCEVISHKPQIVLDGAQNVASARALKEAIKENFKFKRLILVMGISQDKDRQGVCREFQDVADEVILTRADNPRASPPEELARYFEGKSIHLSSRVEEAREVAKKIASGDDLILVTGSLFVVGEFRNGTGQKD